MIDTPPTAARPALSGLAAAALLGCTSVTSYPPPEPFPTAAGTPESLRVPARGTGPRVHRVRFPLVNAYLVESIRTGDVIIVDTGPPGTAQRTAAALDDLGLARDRVSAIILTHAHRDHAGAAPELRRLLNAPVLIHALDAPEVRDGWGGPVRPNTPPAVLGWPFAAGRYPLFEADRTIADTLRLDEFGVAGEALHTPGHTDGSLSIVLDSGDAIAGDLLAGALFDPDRPDRAFFHGAAAPTDRIDASLRALLDRGATRLFLGHGGPVRAEDVRAFIDRRAVPSTP